MSQHPISSRSTAPDVDATSESSLPRQPAIRWVFPCSEVVTTWIERRPVVIGRSRDADCCLPDDRLSRFHAEVALIGPHASIRDLGSRNGTTVNGCRVEASSLVAGDVVRLGGWLGVVTLERPISTWPPVVEYGDGLLASPGQAEPLRLARIAATTSLPVFVHGESGTGKEGVARAIHRWAEQRGPFVAVNCAAIPPDLAEAEALGHRRGAFSGAATERPGFFRTANGGTLFLDELFDLPREVQPKVLRALENREVIPLGDSQPLSVDVRLIGAGQRSLADGVETGLLRADLAARLEGFVIALVPLRQRREDVPFLVRYLVARHGRPHPPALAPRFVEALMLYAFPRNVRQLSHVIQRVLVEHGNASMLEVRHLPEEIRPGDQTDESEGRPSSLPAPSSVSTLAFAEDECALLIARLEAEGGNLTLAAKSVGISRQRAYRLLAKAGKPLPPRSRRGAKPE